MNNNIDLVNVKFNDKMKIRVCKNYVHFDVFADGMGTSFKIEKEKLKEMLDK